MQEVLKHVQLVHDPLTSQEVRSAADRFLYETFFRSEDCWEILIQILQNKDLPGELHFFGAQFLRTKMAKNFRQLQQSQLSQLQNLLLELIKPFTGVISSINMRTVLNNCFENQIILKQMSLVIADFSVQRPEWKVTPNILLLLTKNNCVFLLFENVVKDFVSNLYPNHTLALLNILLCLPEEINSGRIPLALPQKNKIKEVYRICAPDVMMLLETMWNQLPENDKVNRRLVLECFASWSRVFDNIDANVLLKSNLFQCTFNAIGLQDIFTHACSALLELITIASNQSDENWSRIRNLIIDGVMHQRSILERAFSSEDSESTYHISRLFVMTCLEFKADLCKRPEILQEMLKVVIYITRHPAIQVSQQAFRFWTSLMEDRYEHDYQLKKRNGFTDRPDPTREQQELFTEAAKAGLQAVIDAIRYPKEYNNFDEEQLEEWHDHRQYGTEVINDLCRYLDVQVFIQVVCGKLEEPFRTWPKSEWEEIEACFHALNQTVGGAKNKDTQSAFKQIVDVALQIEEPMQMRETITWLLSSYADLPNKFGPEEGGELCQKMLHYCIGGLYQQNRRLNHAGAETFKDICKYSPDVAKQHLDSIVQQYNQMISSGVKLDSTDICEYVWGVCELFHVIPIQSVVESMEKLMTTPLTYLRESLHKGNKSKVHHSLKILSEIFRRTKLNDNVIRDEHPLVKALETIWEYLQVVMERYNTDNDIMEKTTRIIKSTIRGASLYYVKSQLAELILTQVVEIYKSSSKSCFLYLISVYVDCYGKLDSTQDLFNTCLLEILKKTNSLLTDLNSFTNDPELVEDFFELLVRYFKRCPKILLNKEYLDCFMEMSLRGFRIQHYEASKAILLFVQTLIRQGTDMMNTRSQPHQRKQTIAISPETVKLINTILEKHGLMLITELVRAVTSLSYKRIDDYIHIMEAWYQFNSGLLQQALTAIINQLQLDPEFPTKSEFLQTYFSSRQNCDRTRYEAVREFSDACDRFRQTQTYHK